MNNTKLRNQFASIIRQATSEFPRRNPSQDIRIGLWGAASSGKTTYLAMLYEALEYSRDWEVTADKNALQFIRKQSDDIEAGHFPGRTTAQKEIEIFSFTLRPQFDNQHKGSVVLSFIDAPGEFYERPRPDVRVVSKRSTSASKSMEEAGPFMDIIDYLISCDGIIFLLDPERSEKGKKAYRTIIRDLFLEFQDRSRNPALKSEKLQQYLAFSVVKMDKMDYWDRRNEKPSQLAKEIVGRQLFDKLANNYCYVDERDFTKNRFAFFALSSIGRYEKEKGVWEMVVGDGSQPVNTEPETNPSYEGAGGYDVWSTPSYEPSPYEQEPASNFEQPNNGGLDDAFGSRFDEPPEDDAYAQPTIDREKDSRPFNVISPLEWLIKSIHANPPAQVRR